jgi:hypothetical protein
MHRRAPGEGEAPHVCGLYWDSAPGNGRKSRGAANYVAETDPARVCHCCPDLDISQVSSKTNHATACICKLFVTSGELLGLHVVFPLRHRGLIGSLGDVSPFVVPVHRRLRIIGHSVGEAARTQPAITQWLMFQRPNDRADPCPTPAGFWKQHVQAAA